MNSKLLQFYREIEKNIDICNDPKYGALVHPNDLENYPIHNWYRFKEGYSPRLLEEVLKYSKLEKGIKLLDPFCGSGTTLLSSVLELDIDLDLGVGIEVNPYIHFMAKTKLSFSRLNTEIAINFLESLKSHNFNLDLTSFSIPELSTIKKAYSSSTLAQLLSLKFLIKERFHESSYEHDFFMLAYSSLLEEVSCMKKSGRALKIVREAKDYDVKELFINKTKQMIKDTISNFNKSSKLSNLSLINQDVRTQPISDENKFNLVVFSPPYLNHFDYTEVYKIELWMLDFVSNYDDFRSLRFKTLRSHPSVKFEPTTYYLEKDSTIIRELISYIDTEVSPEPFFKSIKGYIDDMYTLFQFLNNITTPDVTIACIVANSLFGSVNNDNLTPVATDLIIAEIAKNTGFDVSEVKVARKMTRRGLSFPYGRESILYFRKRGVSTKNTIYTFQQNLNI
ncbi:hypothetical protein [Brevibacillus sp. HB2.2]|uniref:hypothetical protein n=1 Tax=Brevibacillus sp. HB2.2 TaxID=2738846 RepID=UPI00156B6360|nr:hypothetical protein [Brevibacillus sp. HB2.2]NRS51443.1 hypothetical protein [Brevibacillus sp. HB2.2]